jgi:hypothetical protein
MADINALKRDPDFVRLQRMDPDKARALLNRAETGGAPAVTSPAPTAQSWIPSGINIKGLRLTNPNAPTPAELSREQQEAHDTLETLGLIAEANQLYNGKIKPKLPQLGVGNAQGIEYNFPGATEPFGWQVDPDVQEFWDKLGLIQQRVAKAYMGGRMGKQLLGILGGHIPAPPGMMPFRQTFRKEESQLHDAMHNLKLAQSIGQVAVRDPAKAMEMIDAINMTRGGGSGGGGSMPSDAVRLPSGKWFSKSTNMIYDDNGGDH